MPRVLAALLAGAVVVGCSGRDAPSEPTYWGGPKGTQVGRYVVKLETEPSPAPLGELFAVRAILKTPAGEAVENADVVVDARMPQHGHGMETKPKLREGDAAGGVYVTDGFKFHMPGEWTVTVSVRGPLGEDSTTFLYAMP